MGSHDGQVLRLRWCSRTCHLGKWTIGIRILTTPDSECVAGKNYAWVCQLPRFHVLHYIAPMKQIKHVTTEIGPQLMRHVLYLRYSGPKCERAQKASSDYWKIDGTKAIRVHVRLRK